MTTSPLPHGSSQSRAVLNGKKKVFRYQVFPKTPTGHSMCSTIGSQPFTSSPRGS